MNMDDALNASGGTTETAARTTTMTRMILMKEKGIHITAAAAPPSIVTTITTAVTNEDSLAADTHRPVCNKSLLEDENDDDDDDDAVVRMVSVEELAWIRQWTCAFPTVWRTLTTTTCKKSKSKSHSHQLSLNPHNNPESCCRREKTKTPKEKAENEKSKETAENRFLVPCHATFLLAWRYRLAWNTLWQQQVPRQLLDIGWDSLLPTTRGERSRDIPYCSWQESSLGYGEITTQSVFSLLQVLQCYMEQSNDDDDDTGTRRRRPRTTTKYPHSLTAVDLGSGNGKVLLAAAVTGLFTKLIGMEIVPQLHQQAITNYQRTWKAWHHPLCCCAQLQQRQPSQAQAPFVVETTAIAAANILLDHDSSSSNNKKSSHGAISLGMVGSDDDHDDEDENDHKNVDVAFEWNCCDFTVDTSWVEQADVVICHATVFEDRLWSKVNELCHSCRPGTLFCMVSRPLTEQQQQLPSQHGSSSTGSSTSVSVIETLHQIPLEANWGQAVIYVQRKR